MQLFSSNGSLRLKALGLERKTSVFLSSGKPRVPLSTKMQPYSFLVLGVSEFRWQKGFGRIFVIVTSHTYIWHNLRVAAHREKSSGTVIRVRAELLPRSSIKFCVCKFRPLESQSDVLGNLRMMISSVVWSYFGMPPLLLPGLEPASPGTQTVLTRVRCLSLKPDMEREVPCHPDSRISAKVNSHEI